MVELKDDITEQFFERCKALKLKIPTDNNFHQNLEQVFFSSHFLEQRANQDPKNFLDTIFSCDEVLSNEDYQAQLTHLLSEVSDQDSLMKVLRVFKTWHLIRIIWRDTLKLATYDEIVSELSDLADVCIVNALDKLQIWLAEELDLTDQESLLIVAVGKLGANELNLSSDVDLIFACPEGGNELFYNRLAQRFIKTLHTVTSEGYVYRVDLRLRPFGDSGPLVMSIPAMNIYYQSQGRQWERYALVKARLLTGCDESSTKLSTLINNFVYKKYIDYGVLDSLRSMKKLISKESQIDDIQNDIKRGPGGIREVEFIVQSHQLIKGGKAHALQEASIVKVFPRLIETNCLNESTVSQLQSAYIFLREVEHKLQAVADQQTHTLPTGERDKNRITSAMNYSSWNLLENKLIETRQFIQEQFEKVVAPAHSKLSSADMLPSYGELEKLWSGHFDERFKHASDHAKQCLKIIIPLTLSIISGVNNSIIILHRILTVFITLTCR